MAEVPPMLDYQRPPRKRFPRWLRSVLRIFAGATAFLACVAAALFVPPLWEGISGRDFRPQATTAALLLFILAGVLRGGLRWALYEFGIIILLIEVLTMLAISHFTGFTGLELLNWFNRDWLLDISCCTTLPWAAGALAGSGVLWGRRRSSRGPVPQ